jgi:hypothetical protein
MPSAVIRNAAIAIIGPALGAAAIAVGQVALAELSGVTTLGESFEAGGERLIDVQMTLVAYCCATAVAIAVTAVPATRRPLRHLTPVAAAAGSLAPIPLISARADEYIGGLGTDAVLAGALVGAAAAFVLLATSNTHARAAVGVAAHLALLWLVTLALVPWVDPTIVYAGLVQPLGATTLDDWLGGTLGYHLPTLLPYALAVVVLSGLLGAWFARRGATRAAAIIAAAAAPVLAAVLYPLVGTDLWSGEAAPVAAVAALLGAVAAAIGATVTRRRTRPEPSAPNTETSRTGRIRPARPPSQHD